MSRIFWTFVTVCVIVGVIAAIVVPSLKRARVSPTLRAEHEAQTLYLEGGGEYVPAPPRSAFIEEGSGEYVPYQPPNVVVHNTEDYDPIDDNTFQNARLNPLSTFSIDVDTASYSNVRRFLGMGQTSPKDAVRTEELINYFQYDYPEPARGQPFALVAEIAGCPWKPEHRLVHIGLQGRRIPDDELPPRNLVFLLDASGSMAQPNKLPLLQSSMRLLTKQLGAEDRVAIVVYAGAAGLVLEPTPGSDQRAILSDLLQVLDIDLQVSGSRRELVVPEKLLDIADVDSPIEKGAWGRHDGENADAHRGCRQRGQWREPEPRAGFG